MQVNAIQPAESLPWIESDALTVFGLPLRDPQDDDDNEGEEEDDKGEDNEPPVVREPDRVDYALENPLELMVVGRYRPKRWAATSAWAQRQVHLLL
jgi:hypothetical protein